MSNATKSRKPVICDDCLMAIQDETIGFDFDGDDFAMLAVEFGGDTPDHICEAREYGERCDCACRFNNW